MGRGRLRPGRAGPGFGPRCWRLRVGLRAALLKSATPRARAAAVRMCRAPPPPRRPPPAPARPRPRPRPTCPAPPRPGPVRWPRPLPLLAQPFPPSRSALTSRHAPRFLPTVLGSFQSVIFGCFRPRVSGGLALPVVAWFPPFPSPLLWETFPGGRGRGPLTQGRLPAE